MPDADPVEHNAAEWYTLAAGCSVFPQSNLLQQKGAFSTFKLHTSLMGSLPVFPPNTIKKGFEYINVCPYLLPGVLYFYQYFKRIILFYLKILVLIILKDITNKLTYF